HADRASRGRILMIDPNQREEVDGPVTRAFRALAHAVAHAVGTPTAFLVALGVILVWGASGPLFHYSDTWQLIINTGTTIVTFLVVFLIQNTQNRDAKAIHLKLDELIRANTVARNSLVRLEHLSDAELDRLEKEFASLGENVRHARHGRRHRSRSQGPAA